MNQELMKLYQEHEVNPLGSCLPLVLQLPFFLSLFYLQQSEGFRALVRDTGAATGILGGGGSPAAAHAITGGEKFLFIPDLTVPPTGGVLITLIVIYVLTQLGSSAVSAQAMTDTNQKRLMFALPFLFVPFIINFPAGLLVYWITTNSWTIAQQLLIRKVLPPPHLKDAKDGKDAPVAAGKDSGAAGGAKSGGDGAPKEKRGLGKMLAEVAEGGRAAAADRAEARGASAGRKPRGGGAAGSAKADGRGKSGGAKGSAKGAGGAKAAGGKRSGGAGGNGAKAEKKSSEEGGNGRPQKAPPPSPRKKKKRSGRRR
jgi:YidC/Oxa1 family membrane protein insertase